MSHVVELACKEAPMSPGPTNPLADMPCGNAMFGGGKSTLVRLTTYLVRCLHLEYQIGRHTRLLGYPLLFSSRGNGHIL